MLPSVTLEQWVTPKLSTSASLGGLIICRPQSFWLRWSRINLRVCISNEFTGAAGGPGTTLGKPLPWRIKNDPSIPTATHVSHTVVLLPIRKAAWLKVSARHCGLYLRRLTFIYLNLHSLSSPGDIVKTWCFLSVWAALEGTASIFQSHFLSPARGPHSKFLFIFSFQASPLQTSIRTIQLSSWEAVNNKPHFIDTDLILQLAKKMLASLDGEIEVQWLSALNKATWPGRMSSSCGSTS